MFLRQFIFQLSLPPASLYNSISTADTKSIHLQSGPKTQFVYSWHL